MKLATLNDGTRDGRLIVVSRDLRSAAPVPHARNLQSALDHWDECLAEMLALSARLNDGHVRGTLEFDPRECLSPLPRAYQWAHAAHTGENPPRLTQACSDAFFSPTQNIALASEGWRCDLRAGLAAITGDIPAGVEAHGAASSILLLMLFHDMQLARVEGDGGAARWTDAGAAFSPVAVTPDELGEAWDGERLHARLRAFVNGVKLGELDCAGPGTFGFPELIAQAAHTRRIGGGSIFGLYPSSGAAPEAGAAQSVTQGGSGFASIAELRAAELNRNGRAHSEFLGQGDQVLIDLLDRERLSVFGAITQRIALRSHR